LYNLVDYRS